MRGRDTEYYEDKMLKQNAMHGQSCSWTSRKRSQKEGASRVESPMPDCACMTLGVARMRPCSTQRGDRL